MYKYPTLAQATAFLSYAIKNELLVRFGMNNRCAHTPNLRSLRYDGTDGELTYSEVRDVSKRWVIYDSTDIHDRFYINGIYYPLEMWLTLGKTQDPAKTEIEYYTWLANRE